MKKALFVVAAVAMLAVVAQAGEFKTHTWPCTPTPVQITTIPVKMDIGYWVNIPDQGDLSITMTQQTIHSYSGCTNMKVQTNSNLTLSCSITPVGNVGGDYSCSVNPSTVGMGETTVQVCASLVNANLMNVAGGTTGLKVADVKVFVVPTP